MTHGRVITSFALLLAAMAAVMSIGLLVFTTSDPTDAIATFFDRTCSFASIGATGCADTLYGRWSRIPLPLPWPDREGIPGVSMKSVPVSYIGAAYFTLCALWFLLVPTDQLRGRRARRVLRSVATIAVGISAVFMTLMLFAGAGRCIWCIAIHAINAALAGSVWWITRPASDPTRAPAPFAWQPVLSAGALALVVAGLLGGWHRSRAAHQRTVVANAATDALLTRLRHHEGVLLALHDAEPMTDIPSRVQEPEVEAVLVVFTDFECPACRNGFAWIRNEAPEYFDGRLTVRLRHYPLASECNEWISGPGHEHACEAAWATEAVRMIAGDDVFWAYCERLFDSIVPLTTAALIDHGKALGIDPDDLGQTMRSAQVRALVHDDIDLAHASGVNGTPTYVLDGRRVPALCRAPRFWHAAAARHAPIAHAAGDPDPSGRP